MKGRRNACPPIYTFSLFSLYTTLRFCKTLHFLLLYNIVLFDNILKLYLSNFNKAIYCLYILFFINIILKCLVLYLNIFT